METNPNPLAKFFGVFIQGQTYMNLLYLLLAFPLGLLYFIFLVVGLATGLALVIIWIGLVLLALVIAGWWAFAVFERQLAIWLLRVEIPPMTRQAPRQPGTWPTIVAYLKNPVTWKSLLYLFIKFPLGVLSFVVLVTFGALSVALISAPATYRFMQLQVWFTDTLVWRIDTFYWAVLAFVLGVGLLFISLHLFNGLAWVSGRFARLMLGNYQPQLGPAQNSAAQSAAVASNAVTSAPPASVPTPGAMITPPAEVADSPAGPSEAASPALIESAQPTADPADPPVEPQAGHDLPTEDGSSEPPVQSSES